MTLDNCLRRSFVFCILVSFLFVSTGAVLPPHPANAVNSSDWMTQSWFWDQHPSSQAVPVPVTQQCEVVHFTWERGTATGPDPVAPYTIQVYTSAFVFPFVLDAGRGLSFDWQMPFGPGTLYQACMFDALGNTGGCREIHTVIPGTGNCNNASFPLGPLEVEAKVASGELSQYGWVDQCTNIMLTPKNGTPPYIMTVAPSLHPPLNFTLQDMNPRNWTVTLSWSSPFFVSMVDAAGNFWSYGPLHSGGGGPTACLANLATLPSSSASHSGIKAGATVGAAFGGLAVGALAGLAAAFVFLRRRSATYYGEKRGLDSQPGGPTSPLRSVSSHNNLTFSDPSGGDETSGLATASSSGILGRLRATTQAPIQPFTDRSQQHFTQKSQSGREEIMEIPSSDGAGQSRSNQVYVVHHDGGRAPVTVYHADGTQVVELPPRYANDTDTPPTSDPPPTDRTTSRPSRNSVTSATATTSSDPSDGSISAPVRRPSAITKPTPTR